MQLFIVQSQVDQRGAFATYQILYFGIVVSFVFAAEDKHGFGCHALQGVPAGIDIGCFGIVYELDATYLEAENGKDQTFTSTGKRQVKKGTPADASAVIYELIPSDGSMVFYFQAEGDSLTMLNQELQKAASDLNYTLKLVQ